MLKHSGFQVWQDSDADCCDSDLMMETTMVGAGAECPVCQVTFATNQSMMRHRKTVHEAVKSFQCNICLKSYTQAWTLKAHRLTHSEKRPWKCWCGSGFAEKKSLTTHQKARHSDENAFVCKHCSEKFGAAQSLRKHEKRKHENKHSCDQCGETFKLGSYFRKHILNNHNGTEASKKLVEMWDKRLGIVPDESVGDLKVNVTELSNETEPGPLNLDSDATKNSSCPENDTSLGSKPPEQKFNFSANELDAASSLFEFDDNSNAKEETNDNMIINSDEEEVDTALERSEDVKSIIKDAPDAFIPSLPLFLAEQDDNGHFPCDVCDHMFPLKSELRMHKLFEHEGLRFECAVCGGIFLNQSEMKEHKRLCSKSPIKSEKGKRQPLVCDICGFVARRPDALRQHRSSRHDGVSFNCDKCSKVFMQKRNLKFHIEQMHESEPILCDQCDFKTQREDTLRRHKFKLHGTPEDRSNLKQILCDVCEFSTHRLDSLQNHKLSVHQGIRFNCPECEKTFTQERNVKTHIKAIHLNETTLSCHRCEYTTLWKNSMHQHIKTKHEGVVYKCQICLKALSSQRQLQKHIEALHSC